MARTNIEIDDAVLERAMRLYGLRTKRETVDYALRRLVGDAGEVRQPRADVADADWWLRHFEAVRGHPLGE